MNFIYSRSLRVVLPKKLVKKINLLVSQSDDGSFAFSRCGSHQERATIYRGNRMQFTINGSGAVSIDAFTQRQIACDGLRFLRTKTRN